MSDESARLDAQIEGLSTQIRSMMDQSAELDAQIHSLSAQIQAEQRTNPTQAQADMIQLQALINKRNAAFEVLSSFLKRQSEATKAIVRNLG